MVVFFFILVNACFIDLDSLSMEEAVWLIFMYSHRCNKICLSCLLSLICLNARIQITEITHFSRISTWPVMYAWKNDQQIQFGCEHTCRISKIPQLIIWTQLYRRFFEEGKTTGIYRSKSTSIWIFFIVYWRFFPHPNG